MAICKMEEVTNSIRDNHNMPPKCNMMIIKLLSMSNRKNEDQMVDKTSMDNKWMISRKEKNKKKLTNIIRNV